MSITFTVVDRTAAAAPADLLVVPVFASRVLGPGAEALDAAFGTRLHTFMEDAGFKGERGETLALPGTDGVAASASLLVGLGPRDRIDAHVLRHAAAGAARRATKVQSIATTLLDAAPTGADRAHLAGALAEGFILGSYRFLRYKSKDTPTRLSRVQLLGRGGRDVATALTEARVVADAVCWARDMVNEPAGATSPAELAAEARRLLTGKGVTISVLSEAQLRAQGMGGVVGVGQGSSRPPRFVKVTYTPRSGRRPGTLALVGKGVVFDSGGLSIKPAGGMETMKTDMSGAAAVLAAMSTLRDLGVRHRVVAYAPLVENMPSGTAIRPGDVLRIRDRTTVEVLNTDAEGRLILADALALAVSERPAAIVDVATLTGACMVALGDKVAGLMGNDEAWIAAVRGAADRVGEPVWPLPLPDEYEKLLESEVADLRNISTSSYGGALTAGLFLKSFVGGLPWAHLDIAGPARASSDDGELVKGGTGFAVRTLVELARTFEPPAPPAPPARRAPPGVKKTGAKRTGAKKTGAKKTGAKKTGARASANGGRARQ